MLAAKNLWDYLKSKGGNVSFDGSAPTLSADAMEGEVTMTGTNPLTVWNNNPLYVPPPVKNGQMNWINNKAYEPLSLAKSGGSIGGGGHDFFGNLFGTIGDVLGGIGKIGLEAVANVAGDAVKEYSVTANTAATFMRVGLGMASGLTMQHTGTFSANLINETANFTAQLQGAGSAVAGAMHDLANAANATTKMTVKGPGGTNYFDLYPNTETRVRCVDASSGASDLSTTSTVGRYIGGALTNLMANNFISTFGTIAISGITSVAFNNMTPRFTVLSGTGTTTLALPPTATPPLSVGHELIICNLSTGNCVVNAADATFIGNVPAGAMANFTCVINDIIVSPNYGIAWSMSSPRATGPYAALLLSTSTDTNGSVTASPDVLTSGSTDWQFFTGSTAAYVVRLPVVSTLSLGRTFIIANLASVSITVQSSGSNVISTLASNYLLILRCVLITGTTAASWATAISYVGAQRALAVADGGTGASSFSFTAGSGGAPQTYTGVGYAAWDTNGWLFSHGLTTTGSSSSTVTLSNGPANSAFLAATNGSAQTWTLTNSGSGGQWTKGIIFLRKII